MSILRITVLTLTVAALAGGSTLAAGNQAGNLGYNSYEGYLTDGYGIHNYFGPGVGYDIGTGDAARRYVPGNQWGRYGDGTGHLGTGYGPYIYSPRNGASPRGLFDPLPGAYRDSPPPKVNVGGGRVRVSIPSNIPGIRCVTVTMVAFNNAELAVQTITCAPFAFNFPVLDGVKNVRVRIDYIDNGLSATSYPL